MDTGNSLNGTLTGQLPGASDLSWQKSPASNPQGSCVEATALPRGEGEQIAVRNSRDPEGPALVYTTAEWEAFLDGAKSGAFDNLTA